MRNLVLSMVFFAVLPAAFLRPWIGVLLWSWIGYMNPHRVAWGFMSSVPLAQIVAILTLAGLPFSKHRQALPRTPEICLILLFWVWITVTTSLAYYPDPAWDKWQETSKILLMTVVTVLLFQDADRLKWLIWTIVVCIGSFGVKSGIGAIQTGFRGGYAYPEKSFISDNNDLALAFNMVLPLIWFLAQNATRCWVQWGLRGAFVLTIMGVLTTQSRGGFVGLGVVLIVMAARMRRKAIAVVLLAGVVLLGPFVLPDTLLKRIESIREYEKEASSTARKTAWTVATQIALDSPIVGGGFDTFQTEMWERYAPGYDPGPEKGFTAHSIYFQTLGEHGFVGLAIFLTLLGAAYRGTRRARLHASALPQHSWIAHLARMMQASLAAYMVSGAFLSRAYFDLFYHLVAIVAMMQVIVRQVESDNAERAEVARWSSSPFRPRPMPAKP